MIKKLFQEPHIFYQKPDDEDNLPEMPIVIQKDLSGIICISQEDREIVLNKKSIKELADFLKKF